MQARGEEGLQLGERGTNRVRRIEGVGARRQLDCEPGGRQPVVLRADGVTLRAQVNPRDVAQQYLRPVGIHSEQNAAELVRRLQALGAYNCRVQALTHDRRQAAQLARGDLDVLCLQCITDVQRRQAEVIEFGRIEPDAHCVLRTEQLIVANATRSADGVLDMGGNIVADIGAGQGAVRGHKADDQQEIPGRLGDTQALLLNFRRQERCGQLQFVLHLHLGDIRVGTLFEVQGNRHAAVLVTLGREVQQVIDAAHLLLDNLGDRVLHRLRGGTGIVDGYGNRRRSDAGVLRHRQGRDGQAAAQHDHDGDHPGKDGSVDEEIDHGRAPTARRRPWPGRPPEFPPPSPSRPASRTADLRR